MVIVFIWSCVPAYPAITSNVVTSRHSRRVSPYPYASLTLSIGIALFPRKNFLALRIGLHNPWEVGFPHTSVCSPKRWHFRLAGSS